MRLLQIVILTLIIVYPDDVLSKKGSKAKQGKKQDLGPCGRRYLRQVNGKCYYFAGKKMSWFGAQNNCLRKSLNLADLANEEDFNAVIKFLRTRGNMEDYWFGGNDLQTEGRFTYISTGRPVRYFGGLESIEPTHRANLDDCLEVRLRSNGTTVTDDNCEEKQYFVCQVNELKCAQPVAESAGNEHHSHEHLHHFHHDAGKDENTGNANKTESLESDSRPLDNSNTAEDHSPEENVPATTKPPVEETPETTHETDDTSTTEAAVQQTNASPGNVETTVKPDVGNSSDHGGLTNDPHETTQSTDTTPPTDAPPIIPSDPNAPSNPPPQPPSDPNAPSNPPPQPPSDPNAPSNPPPQPPSDPNAPSNPPPQPPSDPNAPSNPPPQPPSDPNAPSNPPPQPPSDPNAPSNPPPQPETPEAPANPNARAPKEAPDAPIGISTETELPQGLYQITPNTNEFV